MKKSAGSVALTVKRTGGTASDVSVTYVLSGGTAVRGTHYPAYSDMLFFAAGETSKSISIPIYYYATVEGAKTFYVSLYNPTGGGTLGTPAVATVTISD